MEIINILIIINILSFISMGYDKICAILKKVRIPEKTLFILATLYGSLGIILGMIIFHHKTKKKKFTITIPLLLIIQIIIFLHIKRVY